MPDSTPPPGGTDSAELQRLRNEVELAKLREELMKHAPPTEPEREAAEARNAAAIAEDRRKALLSSLPPTEAKALEGNITIDDKVLIENSALAYAALRKVGKDIANAVEAAAGGTAILIHSPKDIGALAAYEVFIEQMKMLVRSFNEVEPLPILQPLAAPAVAGVVMATAAVKSVIDLLALFRSDVTIKGTLITVDELALTVDVAGRLAKTNPHVLVPQLVPVRAAGHPAGEQIQNAIREARDAAGAAATRATTAASTTRLAELRNILDSYMNPLETTTADPESSLMARLVRGEGLSIALESNPLVLYLKVIAAGGSNRVTRNLWRSARLWHSGGVVAHFILMRLDGSVVTSGTYDDSSNYQAI